MFLDDHWNLSLVNDAFGGEFRAYQVAASANYLSLQEKDKDCLLFFCRYTRVLSWASCLRTSKAFCIYATTAVLFAFLSSLILGLSFQRPVDAAPAETGDAWTSVQQLLWPYIGLRHQGPPPV